MSVVVSNEEHMLKLVYVCTNMCLNRVLILVIFRLSLPLLVTVVLMLSVTKSPTVLHRKSLFIIIIIIFYSCLYSAIVSFGPKQRYLGEGAKTQEISNAKNTVISLKRLIGRTFNDPEVQEIEKNHLMAELADANGQAGVKVSFYTMCLCASKG